jgi:hypothetical protein
VKPKKGTFIRDQRSRPPSLARFRIDEIAVVPPTGPCVRSDPWRALAAQPTLADPCARRSSGVMGGHIPKRGPDQFAEGCRGQGNGAPDP